MVPADEHCRRAQLTGLVFGAGIFEISGDGHETVRMSVGLPATARHLLALVRDLRRDRRAAHRRAAPPGLRYEIVLGDESARPAAAHRDRCADRHAAASA